VRIVGTQACYDYPEVDGGCVDLGQYSCLDLSGCQLLILWGQTRQCIIGMVCSDVSIILPGIEDGEIKSYIPESRLNLGFLAVRWQWTTPHH
jgi:hypothetical protein